ncbi:ABC transporter ATP-binding protein [Raineyella fluvialis]|uniref:ATP-binding cassette domain-containing protein n=1 Tax=Raineyella fluvialis TaxID=2662261 RepID=A0A5Q2FBI0_9ACTN|nr:ABC transporter ATP-binding protein [Raineyella fluvialis]QGF24149.1 ATP-binding cassette domain-containing protein [Raineyella fluvialis]
MTTTNPPAAPTAERKARTRRQRFARTWNPVDRTLLEVEDLRVEFHTRDGVAKAINGVSFDLHQGETLAILGESGSGKSVTAQAVMGILDTPPAFVTGGTVNYCGTDLLTLDERVMQTVRGAEISMIFQDALSSLNPVFSVGWQIAEMFRIHRGLNRRDAEERAIRLMERVRIPAARERVHNYPHQFSGGMRQRIMIAMAIALDPHVLIADEPTTALDVTVQAQIMDLLKELQDESRMGLILITHDLGVVADVADRIAVMYAGRLVEKAEVFDLYRDPAHPYTLGLLESIPRLDQQGERLNAIGGLPPNLTRIPPGCPFHPRCRFATDICRHDDPALLEVAPQRRVACHHYDQVLGQNLLVVDQQRLAAGDRELAEGDQQSRVEADQQREEGTR